MRDSVKRVTQFQLRISTGIHQGKISLIENGLMAAREDEQRKIAKALGVRPEEIFPSEPQRDMEAHYA